MKNLITNFGKQRVCIFNLVRKRSSPIMGGLHSRRLHHQKRRQIEGNAGL